MVRNFSATLIVSFLCASCYSHSLDEHEAFCRDKLNNYGSQYENLKTYKECMRQADRLIVEYEQEKILRKQRAIQARIEYEKRYALEQAERERKQAEAERVWEENIRLRKLAEEERLRKERANELLAEQRAQQKQAALEARRNNFSN